MGRVRRWLARHGHRREFEFFSPDRLKRRAFADRNRVPIHSAVMLENGKQGIAGREVLPRHFRGVDFQRPSFTEHEQARGVVDLRIHQDDASHGGVADGTRRLQLGKRAELREEVRRSIEEYPVGVVSGNGYRGLRSGAGFQSSLAYPITVGTVTVPLGKTTTSRRSQDSNSHEELTEVTDTKSPRSGGSSRYGLSAWNYTSKIQNQGESRCTQAWST